MADFTSFLILAEMRTGSNFLEENVNAIPGLRSWGEAFNPHFMGGAGKTRLAGVEIAERNADPRVLLGAMRDRTEGLAGFRYFHDHDPRIFDLCVGDRGCAKIILTRNPLDSYVSLKIARTTNQWRLGDPAKARRARIRFDAAEFAHHLDSLQSFQARVQHRLQTTGQTAFHITYEDVGDLDVINGLAQWLGVDGRAAATSRKTKVQNPGGLRDKVDNYDEMVAAMADFDHFGLSRTPNFEPRRGPNVPAWIGGAVAPLLFMPVAGAPSDSVVDWLAALDGVEVGSLATGMRQKDLRRWKRGHPGNRAFTILRHPGVRAHAVFCRHILLPGPDRFDEIRATLVRDHALDLPDDAPDEAWTADRHRAAFLGYLGMVKATLDGQSSLRVDPAWATQMSILQGMSDVVLPDLVLREDEAPGALARLADWAGYAAAPYRPPTVAAPYALEDILDDAVAAAVHETYRRDFVMLGFALRP